MPLERIQIEKTGSHAANPFWTILGPVFAGTESKTRSKEKEHKLPLRVSLSRRVLASPPGDDQFDSLLHAGPARTRTLTPATCWFSSSAGSSHTWNSSSSCSPRSPAVFQPIMT